MRFLTVWMCPSFSVSKLKVIEKNSTLHATSLADARLIPEEDSYDPSLKHL